MAEETGERGAPRLEFAYLRLGHAGEVADFVQEWIDALAEEGEDVSQLQAGLTPSRPGWPRPQGHYEGAKAALDAHAGFDDGG